jgi:hypothetical protein
LFGKWGWLISVVFFETLIGWSFGGCGLLKKLIFIVTECGSLAYFFCSERDHFFRFLSQISIGVLKKMVFDFLNFC